MSDSVLRTEEWLERFAYENPDSVLVWGQEAARPAALVAIFYKKGWSWQAGAPHQSKLCLGSLSQQKLDPRALRGSWIDPLKRNGEDTLNGFLANNLAVRSFMSALTQTLSIAGRPQKEAEEIVRRAAEKIYPDYAKRLSILSTLAVESVKSCLIVENLAIPKPDDGCLLCSIPDCVDQEWRGLVEEALGLPKKIHEHFGKETRKEVLEAQKWTDKMLKSLKKKS